MSPSPKPSYVNCPLSFSYIYSCCISSYFSTYCGPVGIPMFKYEKLLLLLNSNSFAIVFSVPASNYKNYIDLSSLVLSFFLKSVKTLQG